MYALEGAASVSAACDILTTSLTNSVIFNIDSLQERPNEKRLSKSW